MAHDFILYGRCRSGSRWFWACSTSGDELPPRHGWEDTEQGALSAARASAAQLKSGAAVLIQRHGYAAHVLKEVNAERRAKRPRPQSAGVHRVEYLYGSSGSNLPPWVVQFRITKKTAKRVYFVRHDDPDAKIHYVDRQELESRGKAVNRSVGWWSAASTLYRNRRDALPEREPRQSTVSLRDLKARMVAAHPDKGGTSAEFIVARQAYEQARRRA